MRPAPGGGYMLPVQRRVIAGRGGKPDRIISIRGVRRDPSDYPKLARALIEVARQIQAEEDAAKAKDESASRRPPRPHQRRPSDTK